MAKEALTKKAAQAAEFLKSKGLFERITKWEWEHSRELLWHMVKHHLLPEAGFPPSPLTGANAEAIKHHTENLEAIRKAFDEIVSDGYIIESSNLGKHVAEAGYFKAGKDSAPTRYI